MGRQASAQRPAQRTKAKKVINHLKKGANHLAEFRFQFADLIFNSPI